MRILLATDAWRPQVNGVVRTLERMKPELPVFLENTAGGEHAVARRFDALARLWEGVAAANTEVAMPPSSMTFQIWSLNSVPQLVSVSSR